MAARYCGALYESGGAHELQIVAINELADCKTVGHLFAATTLPTAAFWAKVSVAEDVLTVNGDSIRIFHHENIGELPWAEMNIDLVLECTGSFDDRATAEKHLAQGARRVLFSQPRQAGSGCHHRLRHQ